MIEQALPTLPSTVAQTAEDVIEVAKEAIEGVREWASEAAEAAAEAIQPKPKKKRSKLPLLLIALGLGAVVFVVLKRRNSGRDMDIAPDAFGAAVEAENANPNGERSPISTPTN